MNAWSPLGAEWKAGFEGLVEDVPEWLTQSLWDWVRPRFVQRVRTTNGFVDRFDRDELRRVERVLRISVAYNGVDVRNGMDHLRSAVQHEDVELRLVDYLLSEGVPRGAEEELETVLVEAGSMWRVGTRAGKPGLEKRVPTGVVQAAEEVMGSAGHAGDRLAEAWTAAFGMNPDPSKAYSLAIKAVEDAAIPKVLPNGKTETLGTVLAHMKSSKAWKLPFQREHPNYLTPDVLISQMQLLWSGQADRHGGAHDPNLVIKQEAAESAVMFAVPLVWAFTSGSAAK